MRGAEPGREARPGEPLLRRQWRLGFGPPPLPGEEVRAGGERRRAAAAGEIQIQIWIRARPAGRRELGEEEVAAGEEPEPDGAGWSPGEDPHVGQEA